MLDAFCLQLGYWTLSAILAIAGMSPVIIGLHVLEKKGYVLHDDDERR